MNYTTVAVSERGPDFEDRLARIQAPRTGARHAGHHLFPNADKRTDYRQSSELTGFISAIGYETPLPCKVADLSMAGARLKLLHDPKTPDLDAADLPTRVALRLTGTSTTIVCQIRWRMGAEFGCKFVSHY